MKEKTVRVIKIGKEALYEFLYENMISEEENLLQVSATEVMNSFEELKELCGENEDNDGK